MRLLLEATHQLRFASAAVSPASDSSRARSPDEELVELGLPVSHKLFATAHLAGALAEFAVACFDRFRAALQPRFTLRQAPFLADDLVTTRAGFRLPLLALPHHFFLPRQHCGLAKRFGFALTIANQAATLILSRRTRSLLAGQLGARALLSSDNERQTGRDEGENAQCGREKILRHDLYLQRGRAAVFGSPGDAAQKAWPR